MLRILFLYCLWFGDPRILGNWNSFLSGLEELQNCKIKTVRVVDRSFSNCFTYINPFNHQTALYSVSVSRSVVADSLRPHGLQPTGLHCPGDFPDKDTGVGCHFLLQGIVPTQGSDLGLLHCRQILYQLSYKGNLAWKPPAILFGLLSYLRWPPSQRTQANQ